MEKENLEKTRKLMGALLRQPPKPHKEMKLGRKNETLRHSSVSLRAKPKNDER